MTKFMFIQMFAKPNTIVTKPGYVATEGTAGNQAKITTKEGADVDFELKEFYDTELLENARANLVFDQFAQHQPLPKGHSSVEWRKFNAIASPKKLVEGVTPDGSNITMEHIVGEVAQYGDYVTISDVIDLQAVDPIVTGAVEELGAEAQKTWDFLISEKLVQDGTSNIVPGIKESDHSQAADMDSVTDEHLCTPEAINKAVVALKRTNTPSINGKLVAIVHPSVAYDIRRSDEFVEAHKYARPEEIYNGEIGELHGVRFVESTMAPCEKTSANKIRYFTFVLGKDAYGTIDMEGGNLETIIKGLGSAGAADPLNQRQTVGWKGMQGCEVLYPERIACVYSASSVGTEGDVTNYVVDIAGRE